MESDKIPVEEDSRQTGSINIEHALDTVRQFTYPNISKTIPTLESFELQDGRLEVKVRSSIERTMRFTKDCLLQVLSPYLRSKQKEKRKAISKKVQESVDLVKIYSSALKHMQKGSAHDVQLANKLLQCAKSYNTLVQRTKESSLSLKNKIKRFFYGLAGWKVDEELFQTEIFIPQTSEYVVESKHTSLSGHKITLKNEPENKFVQLLHTTQQKPKEQEVTPKRQELDAFRLKALTVLQHHETLTALSYKELIAHLLRYPIEAKALEGDYGYGVTAICLYQRLSEFPGVTLEIRQVFQRDSFHPDLCFPVKESFTIRTHASQTGFPHPIQYIGFTLGEKLLPSFSKHPSKLVKLSKLLEKKQVLSRKLLPQGELFGPAKKLLRLRKKIFNSNVHALTLLEKTVQMLCKQAGATQTKPVDDFFSWARTIEYPFDFISHVHEEVMQKVIQEPLEHLQHEWLLRQNSTLQNQTICTAMLNQSIEEGIDSMKRHDNSTVNPTVGHYQAFLAQNLKNGIVHISLMLFCEHLHFAPPILSSFEKMLLVSLFRSILIFMYELEEYPQALQTQEHLSEHVTCLLEEELALFSQERLIDEHSQLAFEYVEELVKYFTP